MLQSGWRRRPVAGGVTTLTQCDSIPYPLPLTPYPLPQSGHNAPRPVPTAGGLALRRALTAGLLALVAVACTATAHAAVLVSNINQSADGYTNLDQRSGSFDSAQGFTTGDHPTGYTLTSIDIYFTNTTAYAAPTVTLHSGSPTGTLIDTLSGPTDVSEGAQTFSASSTNIILWPGIEYFVVLEGNVNDESVRLGVTNSDDEDTDGEDDWSIHDDGRYRAAQNTGVFLVWHQARRIRVNGDKRAADASRPNDIWTSTVVVKDHSSNATVGYGSDFTDSTSSATTFTHDSTTYTVQQVYNTASANSVTIVLSPHPATTVVSDWSLKIGTHALPFSDATRSATAFTWTDSAK